MELVNTLKRDLFLWAGFATGRDRPPVNKLMQDFLYCMLRETPRVQRLLLQFPLDWGAPKCSFASFAKLYDDNASSTPDFCSSLTELILLSAPQLPSDRRLRDERKYPFRYFRSLDTLTAIGSGETFDPFRHEALKSIRHLHLLDTTVQLRTLCGMLLKLPQDLVSLIFKQRPSEPFNLPALDGLPTTKAPTLSEALLLKGSKLQELTLVFCYSNCFKNFIGQRQRLTSLPTLGRLEKLTIQKHLLFGNPRNFSREVNLASLLPPSPIKLNILDEWKMDIIERETWLSRYQRNDPDNSEMDFYQTNILSGSDMSHLVHILPDDFPNDFTASKGLELFSSYRNVVETMLLNLAADCRADQIGCHMQAVDEQQSRRKLASLRSVTYQVAPNKPLELFPEDETLVHEENLSHVPELSPVKDSIGKTLSAIKTGSFLCWIPYRWTDIIFLDDLFGSRYYDLGWNEASVRYIRDDGSVGSSAAEGSDDVSEDNEDNEDNEDSKDVESDEGDDKDKNNENREAVDQPKPKLLWLWYDFRNIQREYFAGVTAAFAQSGVQFDCFGDSRPWLLAIRDAAKVEVQELGIDVVVPEDL